jgi:hypothetical protein
MNIRYLASRLSLKYHVLRLHALATDDFCIILGSPYTYFTVYHFAKTGIRFVYTCTLWYEVNEDSAISETEAFKQRKQFVGKKSFFFSDCIYNDSYIELAYHFVLCKMNTHTRNSA